MVDAQANTYQANLPRAHLYLGCLHAFYGTGALIAPLLATAIATSDSTYKRWYYFYFIALGLTVVNCLLNGWVFREDIISAWKNNVKGRGKYAPTVENEAIRQEENAAKKTKANQDFKRIVKRKEVWVLCLYLFFYVGTEVTAGGWVVEFLISVRHGNPSKVSLFPQSYTSPSFMITKVASTFYKRTNNQPNRSVTSPPPSGVVSHSAASY